MRLRWFLVMTAILLATVGITVVIADRLDDGGDAGDQVIGGSETGSTSTTTGDAVLPPGQVTITGTVSALHLEGAVLDPRTIATPLTVVSERGFGNGADITGVRVDGAEATIVWDGGRPFELRSGGALVVDPVTVDLTAEGLRVALSSAVHAFTPGTYLLDTPVAAGPSGVAVARDAVTFEADERTTFEARGDAAILLAATAPAHLLGPGTVHLEGAFEVTDAAGVRPVTVLDMASGAFDVTVTAAEGGGWSIVATLQGETTTS